MHSRYDLPFFDDDHRAQAAVLDAWAGHQSIEHAHDRDGTDAACRDWVRTLGAAGVLRACVPGAHGGAREALDSRSLVVAR
jgi:acyl-CoA dehydrogenase